MRRPVLATALAALGLAAAAAPAPAVIQLERGIAGARLGNTVEQVSGVQPGVVAVEADVCGWIQRAHTLSYPHAEA